MPAKCECGDPGCPCCQGECTRPATMTVFRVDMEDLTGTPVCDDCGADCLESGLFTTREDDDDEHDHPA